jgi:hypothetical protein
MFRHATRRSFLQAGAAGALVGLGDLSFLAKLRPVAAEEANLDPKVVQLRPEIEPLVRLLEDTPREQLLEKVAERIKHGTSYQEVLTALLLAGVRNVQPRPSVGFKFHAVLVVNSAHLASLAAPDRDRWLPIFWALDYYKTAQARDVEENNWTMASVDESKVPPAHKAAAMFQEAMEHWDEEAADTAVASLARNAGAQQVYKMFFRLGARDFRSIGHKAIYVANSYRTLNCIGWRYAEPVVRSLAYALLNREGSQNPAQSDLEPDRPWRRNQELVKKIPDTWLEGKPDRKATEEVLQVIHDGSWQDSCDLVVEQLQRGVAAQSIWDGLLDGAGELLMRQPGIVGLHTLTTTNALHFAFQTTADDETRRLALLQNAAFLPMFRGAMTRRGNVGEQRLIEMEPQSPEAKGDGALEEIFADVSRDRMQAARKVLGYLENEGDAVSLIDAARRLVFLKGNDSHDYKFSSAVLEDYYHVSPQWRNRFLAASVFNLPGTGDRDNGLVERTRAVLQG